MNIGKKFLLILSVLCFSEADASTPPVGMGVCRELAAELTYAFFEQDKQPPSTWEEFPTVKEALDANSGNLYVIKWLNSFALIPEQPVLDAALGFPEQYHGLRLYLMSRKPVPYRSDTSQGRHAIFISDGKQGQKSLVALTRFVPENLALKILEQLDGYDLDKAPVAFSREFVDQIELKRKPDKEHYQAIISDFEEREKRIKSDEQEVTAESERLRFQAVWIAVVILVLAIVVWAMTRSKNS